MTGLMLSIYFKVSCVYVLSRCVWLCVFESKVQNMPHGASISGKCRPSNFFFHVYEKKN